MFIGTVSVLCTIQQSHISDKNDLIVLIVNGYLKKNTVIENIMISLKIPTTSSGSNLELHLAAL